MPLTPEQAAEQAKQRSENRKFYEFQTLRDSKDTFYHMSGLAMSAAKSIVGSLFDTKMHDLSIDGPVEITLSVGDTIQLDCFLNFQFGNLQRRPATLVSIWSTTSPAIATVDLGEVTAVAPGTVDISATHGVFTSPVVTITVI